jgi:taurine transport system permease protein
MTTLRKFSGLLYAAVSIGSVLVLWELSTAGQSDGAYFPTPQQVVRAFRSVWNEGYLDATLTSSLLISMKRLLAGWMLSLLLGLVIGYAMYFNRVVQAIVLPWLAFYRPLPPLAYLSLIVLWLGIDETSKIVLLILAGLPPALIGTLTALESVRQERVEAARSIGLSRTKMIRLIYLPSIAPSFLMNARVAFGACFAALIGAEMIASSSGLAWMVIAATNRSALDVAIVGVFVMAAIALVFDYALLRLQHALVPWAVHEQ